MSRDESLALTKLPGARNHVMNYNVQQVKVYRLQQRMQTQEETVFFLFYYERMVFY